MTHRDFFPELTLDPSNDTFLAFADILEEAGKNTQADLIRATIFAGDTELAKKYGHEGTDARADLERRREHLERQFITELGPEIAAVLAAEPTRISFDRGVIQHLNLFNTPITALPEGLQVVDNLDLYGTEITALPEGLQVGGNLYLYNTQITSLPEGLQVGGNLYLYNTQITSLPEGLKVGGRLNLQVTQLSPEAARRIPQMSGLSDEAKTTGLQSAGYAALAEQVQRLQGRADGVDLPPL